MAHYYPLNRYQCIYEPLNWSQELIAEALSITQLYRSSTAPSQNGTFLFDDVENIFYSLDHFQSGSLNSDLRCIFWAASKTSTYSWLVNFAESVTFEWLTIRSGSKVNIVTRNFSNLKFLKKKLNLHEIELRKGSKFFRTGQEFVIATRKYLIMICFFLTSILWTYGQTTFLSNSVSSSTNTFLVNPKKNFIPHFISKLGTCFMIRKFLTG